MPPPSSAPSRAGAALAALVLVAVASYPCVARMAGNDGVTPTALPTPRQSQDGSGPRAGAGGTQRQAATDLCASVCAQFDECFRRADAGRQGSARLPSVSACTSQCAGEIAVCPAQALESARQCLGAPLRECDRAEIDECLEGLTIACVAPMVRDGGRQPTGGR